MWDMLQEYYFQQSNDNCAYYKARLTNRKRGSRAISEYLQEAKSLSDAFAAIVDPIPKKEPI